MRSRLFIFCVMACAVLLSGCWDQLDIDRRAFITALGIDLTPEGRAIISAQVPLVQQALPAGAQSGGSRRKSYYTISAASDTVYDAFRSLQPKVNRHLVIQHKKLLVIGEETARKGVNDILDWLERSPKTPPQCLIFVARNRTAKETLFYEPEEEGTQGSGFNIIGGLEVRYDRTFFIPHWLFRQKILHSSKDTYAPILDIDRAEGRYVKAGLAVFDGERMVGELSAEETVLFGLLTGRIKSGGISFQKEGQKFALRNIRGNSHIKVDITGGLPRFSVKTKMVGALSEMFESKENRRRIPYDYYQKIIRNEIETGLTSLIKKLQDLNSDPINFGEELRVQHQDFWQNIDWKNVYPTVPFAVKVKVNIIRDGILRNGK